MQQFVGHAVTTLGILGEYAAVPLYRFRKITRTRAGI